jgi:hypothetical protein
MPDTKIVCEACGKEIEKVDLGLAGGTAADGYCAACLEIRAGRKPDGCVH